MTFSASLALCVDKLLITGRFHSCPVKYGHIGTCRNSGFTNIFFTHWGRVTHICVSRLTITGSDNGLSPGRRQAFIWTNAGILLIGHLGTNFSENSIEILTFSFTKMGLKVSSAKWRPFCLGLNVLNPELNSICYWVVFETCTPAKIGKSTFIMGLIFILWVV